MEIPKYVNMSLLFLIREMKSSISSWSKIYGRFKGITNQDEFTRRKFDQYLEIIKPRIYENSMLK
jgi:hypothetical protein